jgi:hypothetical protein
VLVQMRVKVNRTRVLSVLGMAPRDSCEVSTHSTTEPHSSRGEQEHW